MDAFYSLILLCIYNLPMTGGDDVSKIKAKLVNCVDVAVECSGTSRGRAKICGKIINRHYKEKK